MSYQPKQYTTEYKQTSWWERHKDKLYGTNYQGKADAYNREQAQLTANKNAYELQKAAMSNAYDVQKAVNVNKYSWNVQGMQQAGINPMAAMGNVGQAAGATTANAAQGTSAGGMDQGGLGDASAFILGEVKDILHEVSPSQTIKEIKSMAKSML